MIGLSALHKVSPVVTSFMPIKNAFPTATDPCSFNAGPNAQVRAACIASGVAAGLVGVIQANQQTQTLSGGNPNLEPEVAETLTAGFVYTPSFIPNLAITADYFDIEITDLITSFGGSTANVLAVCYGPIIQGNPSSPYCQAVSRLSNGSIEFVSLTDRNVAILKTEGVDVAVSYRFDLKDVGMPDWGGISIRSLYTNTWESTLIPDEISSPIKCADKYGTRCGNPTPRHKLRTTFNWSYENYGVNVVWNFLDDVIDDNPAINYIEDTIGVKNYIDLSFDWKATEHVDFTAGVRNLTQESYPILGGNASPSNSGYPATYDVLGRVFFANVSLRF